MTKKTRLIGEKRSMAKKRSTIKNAEKQPLDFRACNKPLKTYSFLFLENSAFYCAENQKHPLKSSMRSRVKVNSTKVFDFMTAIKYRKVVQHQGRVILKFLSENALLQ